MILHALHERPPAVLAQALTRFESRFTYPLGSHGRFRIDHGDDYTQFFRSTGPGVCLVAERDGEVLGTLSAALRPLLTPGGSERQVLYAGDLKVLPELRHARVLWRLAQALEDWARPRAQAAFSVVMDGTAVTPLAYTGRAGIPRFQDLAHLVIFRIEIRPDEGKDLPWRTSEAIGESCYLKLSRPRFAVAGGAPELRSSLPPTWIVHPEGRACGRLEDTQKAKRLRLEDGAELKSAHLACFAFDRIEPAVDVVNVALREAAQAGHPALFFSVAQEDAERLAAGLGGLRLIQAPATVYGTGLSPGSAWNMSSSEV